MKKLYTTLYVLLVCTLCSTAQGIYQFWGIADQGGSNDQGTLFTAKYDGTGIWTYDAFNIFTPGYNPSTEGLVAVNGKLYGMMPNGGKRNWGLIYEYNPITFTYTKKIDFYDYGISQPEGTMVLHSGLLYGVASGGTVSKGVIFEFNPVSNTLTVKHQFKDGIGAAPNANITVAYHKLYGTTAQGGVDGGVVYSFDLETFAYTKLAEFPGTLGYFRFGPMVEYQHHLFGTTVAGGVDNAGILFRFDLNTNVLVKIADMAAIGAEAPAGGLVRFYNNGNKFYGGTRGGGANNAGVIYEYDLLNYQLTKKLDLSPATGSYINGAMVAYEQKLYGFTRSGAGMGQGTLFSYDPVLNQFQPRLILQKEYNGAYPMGTLCVYNDKLYGFTKEGGDHNQGALLEYDPLINGYKKRVDLGASNGYAPTGKLTYYSGKLYGVTSAGGDNNKGVIYSYDLATRTYAIRHHMATATGITSDQGGMILYNNRLYGVTFYDDGNEGVLYEFNPLNDQYTVKHYFVMATGVMPEGMPVYYNGKLYGTTSMGGDNAKGVLYEYDLATSTYSVKVTLGGAFGERPKAGLTLHNAKLYGTTLTGGANGAGTLFVYTPAGNGFQKLYDFVPQQGKGPVTALAVWNNKLYGTTLMGGLPDDKGVLYSYDLGTGVYTKLHDFKAPGGISPLGSLTILNNKLYGTTSTGGDVYDAGVLYQYDPVMNSYEEQSAFGVVNGDGPRYTQLTAVPALIAPGAPGSCTPGGSALINTTNNTSWVPFTDEEGYAVAEINANGNNLGNVSISFYTHNGATRKDVAGRMYLDRNMTISVQNQPVTPVSVRFYIRKAEFDALKNTPASGILNVSDLTIFKNEEACSNNVGTKALPLTSTVTTWGLDYVFVAQVDRFSSFYLASKAYAALPVKLEYFKGITEPAVNRLQWKASCTDNTDFIVERSTDGIHFSQIGVVLATVADCNKPVEFPDQNPLAGKVYYRLQMKEANGAITYSSIVVLDRSQAQALNIRLLPNPVTGSQATFSIQSPINQLIPVTVYDATGRLVGRTQWQVQKGSQVKTLDVQHLPPGIYNIVYVEQGVRQSIRMVRQ
jgi:uncharacterized repeat protein (TIGR03803 family)